MKIKQTCLYSTFHPNTNLNKNGILTLFVEFNSIDTNIYIIVLECMVEHLLYSVKCNLRVVNVLYSWIVSNANRRVSKLMHSIINILSMVLVFGIFLALMEGGSVQPENKQEVL